MGSTQSARTNAMPGKLRCARSHASGRPVMTARDVVISDVRAERKSAVVAASLLSDDQKLVHGTRMISATSGRAMRIAQVMAIIKKPRGLLSERERCVTEARIRNRSGFWYRLRRQQK